MTAPPMPMNVGPAEMIEKACKEIAKAAGPVEPGRGAAGVIACPKCGRALHYSITSQHNLVRGVCDTSCCLVFGF